MTTRRFRTLITLLATAATMLAVPTAHADDTELFVGPAVAAPPSKPNILFVLDTSGSMSNLQWTAEEYVASTSYSGDCDENRIYWARDGEIPDCDRSTRYVDEDYFVCDAARPALNSTGIAVVERAAQWYGAPSKASQRRWRALTPGEDDSWVECAADRGVHGSSSSSSKKFAVDGSNGPYQSSSALWPSGGETAPVTFYTGNKLNHMANPRVQRERLAIMKSAMNSLLDNLANGSVNVGLMRYSNDRNTLPNASDGGMVVEAVAEMSDAKRASMKSTISKWVASGSTPLSETLYEAMLYYSGRDVYWGLTSDQCFPGQGTCPLASNPTSDTPSVAASRLASNPAKYDSPADQDCQRNYIVYLTDGLPQSDSDADNLIRGLTGFRDVNGYTTCTGGRTLASDGDGTGQCLDELAKWLNESDLRTDRPGVQNVTTYWIGFGDGVQSGTDSMQYVAQRGGGQYYTASDADELTTAFTSIIARILEQTQTFTAPAVAVNAFNRTQNLNYLYMSLFKPSTSYRWLGNIKKYRVTATGSIVDQNGNAAIEPQTGFFTRNSQSYWSDATDGADAALGGAAGELTDPGTRKLYSNIGFDSGVLSTSPLSSLKNSGQLQTANQLLLGVNQATAVAGRPSITTLIDWAYGADVRDEDGDGDTSEARLDMGDPLHSRPATVVYDGPADDPTLVLYGTTNDGLLQAINADDGTELWSFMPRDMLGRIEELYDNEEVTSRVYGLDGDMEVLRIDRNNDGVITRSDDDKVILYFGMRRGGSSIHAIDVTERNNPKLMWVRGPSELPGLGQTWSTPTIARINVDRTWPSTNPDKLVLVFGGGYDSAEDSIGYVSALVGNGIYIVDAISGDLIWRVGPDNGATMKHTSMTNAIPSEVRPIDLTGDGYADRMYAADLGGRLWRFDIQNGEAPSTLVIGGVFARLGLGDAAVQTDTTKNRRFFYAPDVSLIKANGVNFINVAIGSGHRENPITDKTVVNRFYGLRDYNVFSRVASNQYKTTCGANETSPCHQIITDDDSRLVNVTLADTNPTIPTGSIGWKLSFGDVGEKVLAESRTFQNAIYFPTYSPQQREYNAEYCVATVGLNRLYVVDAATSKAVRNLDGSVNGSLERVRELKQGSIAPAVTFVFPTPERDPQNPDAPVPAANPFCLIGLESCGTGLANEPVRTYWERVGTD
jgi:type IV pilus assembly protein PilY1